MAVSGLAPCQCFSPGENQITSPGRISSTVHPRAVPNHNPKLQPGSAQAGAYATGWEHPVQRLRGHWPHVPDWVPEIAGSTRTVPVNQSDGPFADGCEPTLFVSMLATPIRLSDRNCLVRLLSRLVVDDSANRVHETNVTRARMKRLLLYLPLRGHNT
jgi:hypothetical protein